MDDLPYATIDYVADDEIKIDFIEAGIDPVVIKASASYAVTLRRIAAAFLAAAEDADNA